MHSYYSLINMPYKKHYIIIAIFVLLLSLIIVSCCINGYSVYNCYAISDGNHIFIDIPIDNSDAVKKGKYIKINKQKYNYKTINISELKNNGIVNYQTYELEINQSFIKNEMLRTTFYYHSQKIIKKIVKIIF